MVNIEKWGLVPDAHVRDTPIEDDPAITAAVADAKRGKWTKSADLVATTWGDWDRRARVVEALAEIGAKNDKWLNGWRAARPDDPHLAVVDADAWVRLAWEIRGSGRASTTTPAQFRGFHRVLEKAEKAARAAADAAPDDPTPWWTLTTLARGLSYEHEQFQQVWDELVARAPLHRYGHDQALQYWCAKWHGSHDLMLEFAEKAAAKSPVLAGLLLRAAFELEDDNPGAWRLSPVLAALDAVLSQPETGRDDRGFAILALMDNNRYAEAVEQFRALGPHADGAPWCYYDDPKRKFIVDRMNACMRAR